MMDIKYTVLLEDYTTGTVGISKNNELEIGSVLQIEFHDENGIKKTKRGIIKEILEVEELN